MTTELLPSGTDPGPVGVSLILPCLNEAAHIETCLTSLLQGDYPADLIEILILEGMSGDGTRDILARLAKTWPQIRVIDNPGASKPKGLNIGIAEAQHDILIRIDGHAQYPRNYVRDLIKSLHIYEADNVGGVRLNRTKGTGIVARALATVLTHPFGVGDAKHYTGTQTPIESDIIFLFCARKSLFEKVGGFDERLLRGQDREFNLRLNRQGRKMVLCPAVTCTYYTRDRIIPFIRWAFQSGKTPFEISRLVGEHLLSIRNFVPPAFVSAVIGLSLLGILQEIFLIGLACVLVPYLLIGFTVAFGKATQGQSLLIKLSLPFGFFIWHFSYGLGALRGILNFALRRNGGSSKLADA